MSEFVSINISSVDQLLQHGVIRLKSWKGDYLHRPDSPQGATTWSVAHDWHVSRGADGRIMLRSWKGDYLHRPDSPQGVTTWSNGDWTLEVNGETVRLKSWKGDYLHRPDGPPSLTTWNTGIGNEWRVEVPVTQPVAGDLFNTMAIGDVGSYGFKAGSTFTQRFQTAITGVPTELAVRMGSNQNPYRARVVIEVGGAVRFSHGFYDLRQRQSDWATVFPLYNFPGVVRVGDWVSFSITPDRDTAIAALKINDARCPPGQLQGLGAISSRFSMRGETAARAGTYSPEVVDPTMIRSTMGPSGSSWALGTPFTQSFTAVGSGTPRELGVVMGRNQNPFDCTVTVSVRGVKVLERVYTGRTQRQSDWATVFPLDGLTTTVQPGDQVSFTVAPHTSVGFSAIHFEEVGIQMGSVPGYGAGRAQFYMKA